ncbi:Molybdenum cofactor guanylyltransferase [Gammaproteobacteria bacterium]
MVNNKTIAAAILAGGKASRLNGIAKGNIVIKKYATTIITHAIKELQESRIEQIIISANEDASYINYGLPIVKDRCDNCGPFAGIESSLKYYQSRADAVLFLPCDLPNISTKETTALINFYLEAKCKVVFAAASGNKHTLCAIVDVSCLPEITAAINRNIKKIILVWQPLGAKALEFANTDAFVNINTSDDLKLFTEPGFL